MRIHTYSINISPFYSIRSKITYMHLVTLNLRSRPAT